MLHIGICDDNEKDNESLYSHITAFFEQFEIGDVSIKQYYTGAELMNHVEELELLFLDIQLQEDNGIDLALVMRDREIHIPIVLVSSSMAYVKDGYRIEAIRYISKPVVKEDFFAEMHEIIQKIVFNNKLVHIEDKHNTVVLVQDIMFIEVIQHKSYVSTFYDTFLSSKSLSSWITELNNCAFLRPYKSYLVNAKYVNNFNNNFVFLKNDREIPLSRSYKKTFKAEFSLYLGHKL